ncbi:MAG: coiled coil domain-containing protein [Desulfobaccales bacterium]|jgi:predicted nuclease with TOPRIM domain
MSLKEYQDKMDAQLQEWRAKLEELKGRAAKTGAEAHQEMNKQMEALRPKLEAAQQKLQGLKAASGEAAEMLRKNSEKAMEELKKAWDTVKSKFEPPPGPGKPGNQ